MLLYFVTFQVKKSLNFHMRHTSIYNNVQVRILRLQTIKEYHILLIATKNPNICAHTYTCIQMHAQTQQSV